MTPKFESPETGVPENEGESTLEAVEQEVSLNQEEEPEEEAPRDDVEDSVEQPEKHLEIISFNEEDLENKIDGLEEHLSVVEDRLRAENGEKYDVEKDDLYIEARNKLDLYNGIKEDVDLEKEGGPRDLNLKMNGAEIKALRERVDYLNKARQNSKEIERVYRHTLGSTIMHKGLHPSFLEVRPELEKKFQIGLDKEYRSQHTAAHDLVEFLANEAEQKISSLEYSEKVVEQTEKDNIEFDSSKQLLEYLNKARQNSKEIERVYRHVLGTDLMTKDLRPSFLHERPDLVDKFQIGLDKEYRSQHTAAHDLVEFLANEAEQKIKDIEDRKRGPIYEESETTEEKNPEKLDTPDETDLEEPEEKEPKKPETPEEKDPEESETTEEKEQLLSLEDARSLYLKAKRLRGNVIRGQAGSLFKRTLKFGDEKMDFGGREGADQLEKIRRSYQKSLSAHRQEILKDPIDQLKTSLETGELTEDQYNEQVTENIIRVLKMEQGHIDHEATEGIERNILEKLKTGWRKLVKTRIATGLLLGAAAISGVGGAAVVGVRAGMGAVGTYVGVEASLERFSKKIGHKGLVDKMYKEKPEYTKEDLDKYIIENYSDEDVKREAARLRMLQVEKGTALENKNISDGKKGAGEKKSMLVQAIIDRDYQLTANSIAQNESEGEKRLQFADALSLRLATEVNEGNSIVESEVDRERRNKMIRKTTAVIAGSAVGWLISGKLFAQETPEVTPEPTPEVVPADTLVVPENVEPFVLEHTVEKGDSLWKIIESDLESKNLLEGLDEGQRTHFIDALKDKFEAMSTADVEGIGISSGDIDLLDIGEKVDLSSVLDNSGLVAEALGEAGDLSQEQIQNIVENNEEIVGWLSKYGSELPRPLDSEIIDGILQGKGIEAIGVVGDVEPLASGSPIAEALNETQPDTSASVETPEQVSEVVDTVKTEPLPTEDKTADVLNEHQPDASSVEKLIQTVDSNLSGNALFKKATGIGERVILEDNKNYYILMSGESQNTQVAVSRALTAARDFYNDNLGTGRGFNPSLLFSRAIHQDVTPLADGKGFIAKVLMKIPK